MNYFSMAGTLLFLLAAVYTGIFFWAFRTLPQEGWQILAAVPTRKEPSGNWAGLNLTYYGALTAMAVVIAAAIFMMLMGSLSVPLGEIAVFSVVLLACCLPASKFLAVLIERKSSTFTIGGAAFLGLVLAPGLIVTMNTVLESVSAVRLPFIPTLAALAVAYAFGEGTGRLACISFGCCYGKPISAVSGFLRTIFRRHHFTFSGPTKKVAYESALEAVPVIPVQAITAVFFVVFGFIGLSLFFNGSMAAAFLLTACPTQMWRAVSETLRADYRGLGRWSVYQMLALIGVAYSVGLVLSGPADDAIQPDLFAGIRQVWTPGTIISLQLLWLIVFWFTGRSRVTTASISLAVARDRI